MDRLTQLTGKSGSQQLVELMAAFELKHEEFEAEQKVAEAKRRREGFGEG